MKEKLSTIYKILIVIISGIGLYLNFSFMSFQKSIIYFTVQSNLLVFVFYFILVFLILIKKIKKNNLYYILKSIITMAITFTMLGYFLLFLKHGTAQVYIGHELISVFLHVFTPILVILDYFIFGKKGQLKKRYAFVWSMLLVLYIIFDIIFVNLGGIYANGKTYPYVFMDIDTYGKLGVKINCAIIYVVCILLGILIQQMDRRLYNKNESRGKEV